MSRVALSLFIVSFAVALVAEEAGEGAEEIVEHLAEIRESTIEGHEEWAERSMLLTGVLASLAVCHLASSLWLARAHRFLTPLVCVVGLATSATLAITAQKGGEIRHPEAFGSDGAAASAPEHDNALRPPAFSGR